MLRVYGRRSSINVQKVMWLVGELDLPHGHVPAGGDAGGLDTPAFRAMNPHGKVPVIDDDGLYVWESNSILRYLAERYAASQYWPATLNERAHIAPWMDWEQSRFQPDFISGIFWGYYRTPEAQRNPNAIARSLARVAHDVLVLDEVLRQRAFIASAHLTLADISVGTHLFRYFTLDIDREETPHLTAYYRALTQRPAYREHVMLPYDELRGRLAF